MKNYGKYIRETLGFWIILLVTAISYTVFATNYNLSLGIPEGLAENPAKYLSDHFTAANDLAIFLRSSFLPFTNTMLHLDATNAIGSLIIMILFIMIFMIFYKLLYKGLGEKNIYTRLPLNNGDFEWFSFVTGNISIVICMTVSFFISYLRCRILLGKTLSEGRDYIISVLNLHQDKYFYAQIKGDVLVSGILSYAYLSLLLCGAFAIMFLLGAIIKEEMIGYVFGGISLCFAYELFVTESFNNILLGAFGFDRSKLYTYIFISFIVFAIAGVLIRNTLGKREFTKNRFLVYPSLIKLIIFILALLLIMANYNMIRDYYYNAVIGGIRNLRGIFFELTFWIDLFAIGLAVFFIILKSKKKESAAFSLGKVRKISVTAGMARMYLIPIILCTVFGIIKTGDTIKAVNGFDFSRIPQMSPEAFEELWFHFQTEYPCTMIGYLAGILSFSVLILTIVKLLQFLLNDGRYLSEYMERLPVKRRKRFFFKLLLDSLMIIIPICITFVTQIIIVYRFRALDRVFFAPYEGLIAKLLLEFALYTVCAYLLVEMFYALIDVSVSSPFIKLLTMAFGMILLTYAETMSDVRTYYWYYLYDHSGSYMNQIPCTFSFTELDANAPYIMITLIALSLAAILFVTAFLLCRKALRGSMFTTGFGKFFFVTLIVADLGLIVFEAAEGSIIRIVIGCVAIVLTVILLLQKKRPILR